MTIFSLYIYDRHCECVYYQDWHRTRILRAPNAPNFKPGVARYPNGSAGGPSTAAAARESILSDPRSSFGDAAARQSKANGQPGSTGQPKGLPFDEEAKLVYGVVLSLRNMVKKLSGREESFVSYTTSAYKLHLYETLTGFRFVLLSDPAADSLKFVLRHIHVGPFVEHVVRNPLIEVDSRTQGIDNDQFRAAVDRYIRGLTVFAS